MEQIRDFLKIKSNIIFSQDRTCKISETNKKNWLLNIVPLMKEINSEKRKNQIKDHWVNYMDNENKIWGLSVPSSELTKDWLSGMVDGDGSFFITITKAKDYKIGYQVRAKFAIKQINENYLLERINKEFFENKGKVQEDRLIIEDLKVIREKVIPIFDEVRLKTRKEKDYVLWKKVVKLIEKKEHLTLEGLKKIKNIKLKMELNREGIFI